MEYIRAVINGYRIISGSSKKVAGKKDIRIIYFNDRVKYTENMYFGVSETKIKKIRKTLNECIFYNIGVEEASQAISFLDILYQLNNIIVDVG